MHNGLVSNRRRETMSKAVMYKGYAVEFTGGEHEADKAMDAFDAAEAEYLYEMQEMAAGRDPYFEGESCTKAEQAEAIEALARMK
jgi:hypothetical protein